MCNIERAAKVEHGSTSVATAHRKVSGTRMLLQCRCSLGARGLVQEKKVNLSVLVFHVPLQENSIIQCRSQFIFTNQSSSNVWYFIF